MTTNEVSIRELSDFLREDRRLVELGQSATFDESVAYYRQKADLFRRIAARPRTLVDQDEAAAAAETADRRLASVLRYRTAVGGGVR